MLAQPFHVFQAFLSVPASEVYLLNFYKNFLIDESFGTRTGKLTARSGDQMYYSAISVEVTRTGRFPAEEKTAGGPIGWITSSLLVLHGHSITAYLQKTLKGSMVCNCD